MGYRTRYPTGKKKHIFFLNIALVKIQKFIYHRSLRIFLQGSGIFAVPSYTGNLFCETGSELEEAAGYCKSSRCLNRVATAPFELKPGQNDSYGLHLAF